jgi:hypothetical protein
MNWKEILKKREHVFIFNDTKPDFFLIKNILTEMHEYMPVKQNKLLFEITVIDNTLDYDKKLKIYESTRTSEDQYRYNPQVLAPYLFLFFIKEEAGILRNEALMQIGMAAMFINFSAINQKIDIGYCRCINYTPFIQKNYEGIQLIIGLGHKSSSNKYLCPIDNVMKTKPPKILKKCSQEEYIFCKN